MLMQKYILIFNRLEIKLPKDYICILIKIMKNIVLFGPPGAGKGTQAEIIKQEYDLFHISTGDVFRYNIKNNTDLGLLAKGFMDKGELVPDQITIDMLSDVVEKNSHVNGFIFDGFPRTESQAHALDSLLKNFNTSISGMIALEVDDEILINRLLERGKDSGRADDSNREIIENRISEYYNKTAILKTYYQRKNCYYGVNGVGEIDEITSRIIDVMSKI